MSICGSQMNAPLHEQVRLDILQRVLRGEFKPDIAIPNENQLCEEYGVSRITIRRAISDLCTDEILYRRQGVGTFVTDVVRAAQAIKLRGSLADVLAEDPRIVFALVSEQSETSDAVRSTLKVDDAEAVSRLDFKVMLKGEPFALAQLAVPAATIEDGPREMLNGTRQPILQIAEWAGTMLAAAFQTIHARSCDDLAASILGIPVGSPILQIRRRYLDTDGQTTAVVTGHFHPERIEFNVKLQLATAIGWAA